MYYVRMYIVYDLRYNIILNTVPEAGSSPWAAPLSQCTLSKSLNNLPRYNMKNNIVCVLRSSI